MLSHWNLADTGRICQHKWSQSCPPTGTLIPDIYLDCFSPIDLNQLTSIVYSSKLSTWILDPIASKLFEEMLPPINTFVINMSLLSRYVTQSCKEDVIKPLLKKSNLDPKVMGHYRPISNLPFLTEKFEKTVAQQLCEYNNNLLLEKFHQDLEFITFQRQH